ncbi:MAG: preprotein translocase subunit SecE [Candidatus Portnoybacteria bacterium CG10_big_fil_rev_8_21_14_0_10_36_7]|uniref:Protein translocase subunit SecE n=1 Tax=Candidatus Portnoybacteria bacterium CG10_big_fil_rev_8_21_14_0_10_36_7 TaxID=1974812 RepID=A0A2M8KF08_9BACT|nr:MAG: preprotein translocase subunit SecE [Candidatus Portnoybacteria bacterium CG10_big_fil_rev_8_21_14_0_10_36_7]
MSIIIKLSTFLVEVRQEMRKVTWPNRQETFRYTVLVISVSIGVAIILGAFDAVFVRLLNIFIGA